MKKPSRVDRAISLASKIPRSANPLAAPYNLKPETETKPQLKAGDCWWMEDGEIKKGRAGDVPYRERFKPKREPVLTLGICLCRKCLERQAQLAANPKNALLRLKLEQHTFTACRYQSAA